MRRHAHTRRRGEGATLRAAEGTEGAGRREAASVTATSRTTQLPSASLPTCTGAGSSGRSTMDLSSGSPGTTCGSGKKTPEYI